MYKFVVREYILVDGEEGKELNYSSWVSDTDTDMDRYASKYEKYASSSSDVDFLQIDRHHIKLLTKDPSEHDVRYVEEIQVFELEN